MAAAWAHGQLLSGYIDLVVATAEQLDVIDLKTDAAPTDSLENAYPEYVSQIRIYSWLLETAGVVGDRRVRGGLLFTADGIIRWVQS